MSSPPVRWQGDAIMRMRIWFTTGEPVKYVGHLDLVRAWERSLRRSGLLLAYSQGFNPQPRIHFAAALPLGFTGQAEIVDVYLDEEVDPAAFRARLEPALPPGIAILAAKPVAPDLPSLQSQVCGATYRVEVETDEPDQAFRDRLEAFLARTEAWRERRRGGKVTRYDLRPLVLAVRHLERSSYGPRFEVDMKAEPSATGRPDELLAELGLGETPRRITRVRLVMRDGNGDGRGTDAAECGGDDIPVSFSPDRACGASGCPRGTLGRG